MRRLRLFFLVLGVVYSQVKHGVQSTGDCNDYIQMALSGTLSTNPTDLYTHIVTVRSGTNLKFICSGCYTTVDGLLNCWYSGRRNIGNSNDLKEHFTADSSYCNGDASNCTINQLNYTVISSNSRTTIYCEDPNNCHKKQLPICFNGTISHAVVVIVNADVSPLTPTTIQPTPSPPPSTPPSPPSITPPTPYRATSTFPTLSTSTFPTPPLLPTSSTLTVVLAATVPVAIMVPIGLIILVVILLKLMAHKSKKQNTSFDCHNIRNPMSLNESLEYEPAGIPDESNQAHAQTRAEVTVDKQKDEVLSRL